MSNNTNSEILFDGKIPLKAVLGNYNFFIILLFGWNFGLLTAWLTSLSNKLTISNRRVTLIKGLISQKEESIDFYRVQDSNFEQSIFARILGVGKITLLSDDSTAPIFSFAIVDPKTLNPKIRDLIREERKIMRTLQTD